MSKLTIILFLILTGGCSLNPISGTDVTQVAVLAVLSPDYSRQTIVLVEGTNIVDIEEVVPSEIDRPVQHAGVVVRSAQQAVNFTEVAPGLYQNTEAPLRVLPGESYFLEVQDAKGRQLRAQTTVPGLFQITRPADGATFASDSYVEFSWEPSSGAGIYVLGRNLSGCEAEYNDRNFGYYGAFGATTASLIAWLNTFCFTSPQVQTFKVLAYDSALAAYQYSVGRNGSQFQRSNVEGGLGVFGSMVADSLALTITPQL